MAVAVAGPTADSVRSIEQESSDPVRSLSARRPTVGVRLTLVALAVTVLAGCTDEGDDASTPPPTSSRSEVETPDASPTPTPDETPELAAVQGERRMTVRSVASDKALGRGTNPEPRQRQIERTVTRVTDWLDSHLDRLQRTGTGLLGEIAADGLAPPQRRAPVTTDLASPERPVAGAVYHVAAYHDGAPRLLSVRVVVRHPEGPPTLASMGFVVTDSGRPILTMFSPIPKAAR